jgi:hypothetical protein
MSATASAPASSLRIAMSIAGSRPATVAATVRPSAVVLDRMVGRDDQPRTPVHTGRAESSSPVDADHRAAGVLDRRGKVVRECNQSIHLRAPSR